MPAARSYADAQAQTARRLPESQRQLKLYNDEVQRGTRVQRESVGEIRSLEQELEQYEHAIRRGSDSQGTFFDRISDNNRIMGEQHRLLREDIELRDSQGRSLRRNFEQQRQFVRLPGQRGFADISSLAGGGDTEQAAQRIEEIQARLRDLRQEAPQDAQQIDNLARRFNSLGLSLREVRRGFEEAQIPGQLRLFTPTRQFGGAPALQRIVNPQDAVALREVETELRKLSQFRTANLFDDQRKSWERATRTLFDLRRGLRNGSASIEDFHNALQRAGLDNLFDRISVKQEQATQSLNRSQTVLRRVGGIFGIKDEDFARARKAENEFARLFPNLARLRGEAGSTERAFGRLGRSIDTSGRKLHDFTQADETLAFGLRRVARIIALLSTVIPFLAAGIGLLVGAAVSAAGGVTALVGALGTLTGLLATLPGLFAATAGAALALLL